MQHTTKHNDDKSDNPSPSSSSISTSALSQSSTPTTEASGVTQKADLSLNTSNPPVTNSLKVKVDNWKPVEAKYKYRGLDSKKRGKRDKQIALKKLQPDYSNCINFHDLKNNNPENLAKIVEVPIDFKKHGLPPTTRAYTLTNHPGFFVLVNALSNPPPPSSLA